MCCEMAEWSGSGCRRACLLNVQWCAGCAGCGGSTGAGRGIIQSSTSTRHSRARSFAPIGNATQIVTGVVLGVEFSKHDNKLPNNVAVGVLVSGTDASRGLRRGLVLMDCCKACRSRSVHAPCQQACLPRFQCLCHPSCLRLYHPPPPPTPELPFRSSSASSWPVSWPGQFCRQRTGFNLH